MRDLKSKLKMPAKRSADAEVEEDLSLEGLDLESEDSESDPALENIDSITSTDSEVEAGGLENASDEEIIAEMKARGLSLDGDMDAAAEESEADAESEDLELPEDSEDADAESL
jgi:hypothetical protein